MKIIKRERPRTVPFGELKTGDEFRLCEDSSRCMRTNRGWVFLEGDFKGDEHDQRFEDIPVGEQQQMTKDRPVYPDPPREAEKVRFEDIPVGEQPFMLDGLGEKFFLRIREDTHFMMGDKSPARAVWLSGVNAGTLCHFPDDALVTPIDATLEY